MAAVMRALELDFKLWQDQGGPEARVKRGVRDLNTFMRERHGQGKNQDLILNV